MIRSRGSVHKEKWNKLQYVKIHIGDIILYIFTVGTIYMFHCCRANGAINHLLSRLQSANNPQCQSNEMVYFPSSSHSILDYNFIIITRTFMAAASSLYFKVQIFLCMLLWIVKAVSPLQFMLSLSIFILFFDFIFYNKNKTEINFKRTWFSSDMNAYYLK